MERLPRWLLDPMLDVWTRGLRVLAVCFALLCAWVAVRALYEMVRFGPRAFLRNAFRADDDRWRLLAILLVVAVFSFLLRLLPQSVL